MTIGLFRWLKRRPQRWAHLDQVPLSQLAILLLAIFLLFSVIGFYTDIMAGGQQPYAVVLADAAFNGLNGALWILALARFRIVWLFVLAGLQVFSGVANVRLAGLVQRAFDLAPIDGKAGLRFAATAILVAIIVSYICFVNFIRRTGRESFRLKNELALAHSIQKTLVPPVHRSAGPFEVYGISRPSEKVGGDLVDAVELPGGDMVAYLADIAGHGLQAGILMGMLKTAARTALLNGSRSEGEATLSMLMEQLNTVLPQVKETHMYATFTALRLNLDGQSFYGVAASPPVLHWDAAAKTIARIQEDQFPLGLLPVSGFPARRLTMRRNDVLLIATDGIYEVASRDDVEFGIEALETLLACHAEMALPELAALILETVRGYGKQVDDQTLLLVRRGGLDGCFP